MRRLRLLLLAAAVAGGTYVALSHRPGPSQGSGEDTYPRDGKVRIARPVQEGNGVGLKTETVEVPKDQDPVRGALVALLSLKGDRMHPNAMPQGTRLLDLRVKDGVATVDLSREFNTLRQGGDTGESQAQNALRKTLAQFPQVKSMRVLVEGKPFESEHTDWTEPIPVRDENADVEGGR